VSREKDDGGLDQDVERTAKKDYLPFSSKFEGSSSEAPLVQDAWAVPTAARTSAVGGGATCGVTVLRSAFRSGAAFNARSRFVWRSMQIQ